MADARVIVADNVYKNMEDMGDGTHAERVVIVNQTEYVLAYQPITTNQTVVGVLSYKTY